MLFWIISAALALLLAALFALALLRSRTDEVHPATYDLRIYRDQLKEVERDLARGVIDEAEPRGWDEIFASHTFHEVTMYYPMRVIRNRRHKFIWNLAHRLEYPMAEDLWRSATWQSVLRDGLTHLGARPIEEYKHRPRCELYDLESDPEELHNVADRPESAELVKEYMDKLKAFQEKTADPWLIKWRHE